MRRKASFTLLEILIATFLVAIAVSATAIAIPKFLSGERFEKEVKTVENKIALVQELVIDTEQSLSLVFDNLQLLIEPANALPKRWLRPIKPFKEIESVSFDGEVLNRLVLQFDGQMGGCPRGRLTLSGKKKSVDLYLPGFPGQIKRTKEVLYGENAPYPQELLSAS